MRTRSRAGPGSTVARVVDGTLIDSRLPASPAWPTPAATELDRPRFRAGQLVRVRPAGVEPGSLRRRDRRRVDPHDVGRGARGRRTHRPMLLESREALRRLHDAARPASPDRRRPLRADAGEPDPRRADWSAIYYHRADRDGDRLRSHAARQQRRRAVPRRRCESSGPIQRRRRRSCCCGSIACRGSTAWPRAARCGRTSSTTTRAARRAPARWSRAGRACVPTWMPSVTRRCWRSSAARRRRGGLARQVPELLSAIQQGVCRWREARLKGCPL